MENSHFFVNAGRGQVEKFIQRENLALFKKRLTEPHSDAERDVLLKLPAAEEAKETHPRPKS
jgi:hypothetical protein